LLSYSRIIPQLSTKIWQLQWQGVSRNCGTFIYIAAAAKYEHIGSKPQSNRGPELSPQLRFVSGKPTEGTARGSYASS
jgi:hypothetical protein